LRRSVVAAAADLSVKEKAVNDAAEADKAAKVKERDLSLSKLNEASAALKDTEEASESSQMLNKPVLLAGADNGRDGGDFASVLGIQDNFLQQDDLSTYLDACISSLDLLQRPAITASSATTADAKQLENETVKAESQVIAAAAQLDLYRSRLTNPTTPAVEQRQLQLSIQDLEDKLAILVADARAAKSRFISAVEGAAETSRFGKFCEEVGLLKLIDANTQRAKFQERKLAADLQRFELRNDETSLRMCQEIVKAGTAAAPEYRAACAAVLTPKPRIASTPER
jgi:hypothetical protein